MRHTVDKPSAANRVPAVTVTFWIVKILSTTVGETGADYLALHAGWGAGLTALLVCVLLIVALALQLRSPRLSPWKYWLVVVLVSIVGTELTDGLTDRLRVSLYLSTGLFAVALGALFWCWYRSERTLSIRSIDTPRREWFYWSAILCTFALGTAAGDLATEAVGLGFRLGAGIFAALIWLSWLAWRCGADDVLTFWIAYILTRPLGAALGDWLTQAPDYGGLGAGPNLTSAVFLALIVILVAASHWQARRLQAIARSRP